MKSFKNFLNEAYNSDAQNILEEYVNYLKTIKSIKYKSSEIEYNVIDKEYFFSFTIKRDEYSIYIDRKNMDVFIVNMDTGDSEKLVKPEDVKKFI